MQDTRLGYFGRKVKDNARKIISTLEKTSYTIMPLIQK